MIFENYNNILWDFDGVILNSEEVRTEGFRSIFKNYDKSHVNKIILYHKKNGGLSRYNKIDYFFNKVLNEKISLNTINKYALEYSNFCFKKLCNPSLIIKDSIEFIEKNHSKYNFHIVSASDQNELRQICNKLNLTSFFISIIGSPITKTLNIKNLITERNYIKNECCLIGDSFNDKQAAYESKIGFFGYNNVKLSKENLNYIKSFKNL